MRDLAAAVMRWNTHPFGLTKLRYGLSVMVGLLTVPLVSGCGMARDVLLPAPTGVASIHKIGGGGTPYSIKLTKIEDIATGELLYDQGISAVKLITEGVYFKVPPGNYRVYYTCEVTQSEQMLSEGSVELTARDGYRYLALVDMEERVERYLHYPARVVRTCKAIYDERRWLW